MQQNAGQISVYILSGFLGTGKTTILERLLRAPEFLKTAAIINEFGEVGLDHSLVSHTGAATSVIEAGCACCQALPALEKRLLDTLTEVSAGRAEIETIIIETSGVSDPLPILNTIRSNFILNRFLSVKSVMTVVDCTRGRALGENYSEAARQIAVADLAILSKLDISSEDQANDARAYIKQVNPDARVIRNDAPDLSSQILHHVELMPRERDTIAWSGVKHIEKLTTFSLRYDSKVDWSRFVIWLTMILDQYGAQILRFKGLLNTGDANPPLAIHSVQHLMFPPYHLPSWPDADVTSRLAFIVDGIPSERLRSSLDEFMAL